MSENKVVFSFLFSIFSALGMLDYVVMITQQFEVLNQKIEKLYILLLNISLNQTFNQKCFKGMWTTCSPQRNSLGWVVAPSE